MFCKWSGKFSHKLIISRQASTARKESIISMRTFRCTVFNSPSSSWICKRALRLSSFDSFPLVGLTFLEILLHVSHGLERHLSLRVAGIYLETLGLVGIVDYLLWPAP